MAPLNNLASQRVGEEISKRTRNKSYRQAMATIWANFRDETEHKQIALDMDEDGGSLCSIAMK